ncbi:MAG: EAL domain-containing protein [Nitratireductor sp.]
MIETGPQNRPRMVKLAMVTALAAFLSLWQQVYSMVTTGNAAPTGLTGNSVFIGACTVFITISVSYFLWRMVQDMRQVNRLAFTDELTGLANRRQFDFRLNEELARGARSENAIGLLYLDLDKFKHINDSYGHEAGDQVIVSFGQRIKSVLRAGDFLARLSGDEFSAIITNVKSRKDIELAADRIFSAMAEPIQFKQKTIYAGVSIGAAIVEPGTKSGAEALRHADFALLQAKESGRNKLQVFDPGMAESIRSRGVIENDLREAIINGRFTIKYQPLISQKENKVLGVEALVRWIHDERGPVSPSVFIPIAEEIGMIDKLGEFILRRACTEMLDLKQIKLAVNISALQFTQRGFIQKVAQILEETGFEPDRLELEITESVFMSDPQKTREVITGFKELGVRIALDDFGTGFSAMSYLRDFPVDRIKIDRSFISEISNSGKSMNLVSHMIELGSALGLHVTVEGVETEDQLKLLSTSGCNELQGYLFSRPVGLEQLRTYCESLSDENVDYTGAQKANLRLVG